MLVRVLAGFNYASKEPVQLIIVFLTIVIVEKNLTNWTTSVIMRDGMVSRISGILSGILISGKLIFHWKAR